MFNELSVSEQYDIDGGIPLIVAVPVVIFVAGALKGCTDEAAKDN